MYELIEKNRAEIIETLKNGECFVCGKKGYKNIIGHVVLSHGYNSKQLKDSLLIKRDSSFWSDERIKEYSKRAKELDSIKYMGKDRKGHKLDEPGKKKLSIIRKQNPNIKTLNALHSLDSERRAKDSLNKKIATDPEYKRQITERVLNGHKNHMEKVKAKGETKKCLNCGKEYFSVSSKSQYCSNNCKQAKRYNDGIDLVERICVQCSKPFMVNKFTKISHCSKSCANITKWKNKRELNQG